MRMMTNSLFHNDFYIASGLFISFFKNISILINRNNIICRTADMQNRNTCFCQFPGNYIQAFP